MTMDIEPTILADDPEAVVAEILLKENDSVEALHLNTDIIDTPIGSLFAAADAERLYLLHLARKFGLQRKVATLHSRVDVVLVSGGNAVIEDARDQLESYFAGSLRDFAVPLALTGTMFQNSVWNEICTIPYGATQTYTDIAARIGRPSSFRAVAQALALNPILILMPCHRVLNTDGSLGGYSGGPDSKDFLLDLERANLENGPPCGKNDGELN